MYLQETQLHGSYWALSLCEKRNELSTVVSKPTVFFCLQVLPLQLEMKTPNRFASTMGVLNVGMTIVTFIILTMGFVGFWRFGDDVKGSLTLNLPPTLM